MRHIPLIAGLAGALACASPPAVAQAQGGGIGGSLTAPEARLVRPRPRLARAPAPRVIVKREVVYEPRYVERPAAPARRRSVPAGDGLASYDGIWAVSSGGCSGSGTGQVVISRGRITGSSGTGRVSSTGAVSTVSAVNGVTIVGQGQIVGQSAAGVYRQSDGCSGSWSAVKL